VRVVLSSRLIRESPKSADQFLKDKSHMCVANNIGMEINGSEFLHNLIKQICIVQLFNLRVNVVFLEDVPRTLTEGIYVANEIGFYIA
jgi:hypothetical protein